MKNKSLKIRTIDPRDIAYKYLLKSIDAYNISCKQFAIRDQSIKVIENKIIMKHMEAYKNYMNARANFIKSGFPKSDFKVKQLLTDKYYNDNILSRASANIFMNRKLAQIIHVWGPKTYGGIYYTGPVGQSILGCIDPPTLHYGVYGSDSDIGSLSDGSGFVGYGFDIEDPNIIGLDLSAYMKCGGIAYIEPNNPGARVELICNIHVLQYRGIGKPVREIGNEYWNYTPYRSGQAFPDPDADNGWELGNTNTVTTANPGMVTLNPSNPKFNCYICDVIPGDSFLILYSFIVTPYASAIYCSINDSDSGHIVLIPPYAIEHSRSIHFATAIPTAQYRIIVETRDKKYAGTDAAVYLTIYGIGEHSDEYQLISADSKIDPFERNSISEFNIVLKELGPIQSIRIRHNNQGSNPGWFLDKVTIQNLTTGLTSVFPCGKWLAVDQGDGSIDRILQHE